MKANGTLTLRYFEAGGTSEIEFDWDGGPVIELTVEAIRRYKNRLYRNGADENLIKGLFVIPGVFNARGKLGPYKIMCIGWRGLSQWEILVARTDTIAGRMAITRARIEETGLTFKLGFLKILRAWNLAKFEEGEVPGWYSIKVVRWIQERTGR